MQITPIYTNKKLLNTVEDSIKNAKKSIVLLHHDYEVFKNDKSSLMKIIKDGMNNRYKTINRQMYFFDNVQEQETTKNVYTNDSNPNQQNIIHKFYKKTFLKELIYNAFNLSSTKKSLSQAILESDVQTTQNALENIKKELIKFLQNIDDLHYDKHIKEQAIISIQTTIDDILSNIKTSKTQDNQKMIVKSVLKFIVNIFDGLIDLKGTSLIKRVGVGVNVLAEAYLSYSDYKKYADNPYYYDIAYPMLNIILTKLYPIFSLCNERYLSNVLIIDDKKIIDFSSYMDIKDSFYTGCFYYIDLVDNTLNVSDYFKNDLKQFTNISKHDEVTKYYQFIFTNNPITSGSYDQINYTNNVQYVDDKKEVDNNSYKVSFKGQNLKNSSTHQCLSNDYYLEGIVKNDINNFLFFMYAEYPDLNSTLLIDFINNKFENTPDSTQMKHNYLFITNPPQISNAKLNEDIYKNLKMDIKDRPKKPDKAKNLALSKNFNPCQDYSDYKITKSNNAPYVLQLSPFIKLNNNDCERFNFFIQYPDSFYYQKNNPSEDSYEYAISDEEVNLYEYMGTFFRSAHDIKKITDKQKDLVATHLQTIQAYLKIINDLSSLRYQYIINSQLTHESNHVNSTPNGTYYYLQVLFLATLFHMIKTEFNVLDLMQKSFGTGVYNRDNNDDEICIPFYAIKIENYEKDIYFIPCDMYLVDELDSDISHTNDTDKNTTTLDTDNNVKKTLVCLSRKIKLDKMPKHDDIIYIDELSDYIFNSNIDYDETTIYSDFMKHLEKLQSHDNQSDSKNQLDDNLNNSEKPIIYDNEISKLSIEASIFEIFKNIFPFYGFFESYPKAFGKLVKFFVNVFDKDEKVHKANRLHNAIIKEMGVIGALFVNPSGKIGFFDTSSKDVAQEIINPNLFYFIKGKYYYFAQNNKHPYIKQTKSFKKLNEHDKIKTLSSITTHFKIQHLKEMSKSFSKEILKIGMTDVIDKVIITNYDMLKLQYNNAIYKSLYQNYHHPLATTNEDFTTFPMQVNSRFMSFDFSRVLFGGLLCTGGLTHHKSMTLKTNDASAIDFTLQRLLSYLIIDEKRSLNANVTKIINDLEFYANTHGLYIRHASIYKVDENENVFKDSRNNEKDSQIKKYLSSPIHAYNEALQIIEDYAQGYFTSSKDSCNAYCIPDENKARRLIECLDIIGQNNLKAMYVKEKSEKDSYDKNTMEQNSETMLLNNMQNNEDNKTPPRFVGRLATTIIMEDGLWIG